MLRLVATLCLGMALGYCAFFVKLEGKTLLVHAYEVWQSPVVRQKVEMVTREVPKAFHKVVNEAPATMRPQAQKAAKPGPTSPGSPRPSHPPRAPLRSKDAPKNGREPYSPEERAELDTLVQRAQRQ